MNHRIAILILLLSQLISINPLIACQGSGSAEQDAQVNPTDYFSDLLVELKKSWPKNRTVRMAFHGHSVPAGYFTGGNVKRFDSYPILFNQKVCEFFPKAVIDVCVTAIGGEGAVAGAKRFKQDVLALRPDVVFIDYGLNDRYAGLEASYVAWRAMIQDAIESDVKIVLLTPTPDSTENILDSNSRLAQHAAQIRKLSREFSVPVVDSFERFRELVAAGNQVNKYLSQANHPNRLGHAMVAELLAKLFKPEVQEKTGAVPDQKVPNIIWIMAEDISTDLACYGESAVKTPNLDKLAIEGVKFTRAFCTAPSCTPSRNAMMTGVYQTRTDTQDQRRGGVTLPENVKPITHWLRKAGYYTAIGCGYSGKTDLNFDSTNLFDGTDWEGRKPNQPFFAQITLGATHRHGDGWPAIRKLSNNPVNPDKVKLPPYLPDHPDCRMDWALYLDAMQKVDVQVGQILERLQREQIADNTVVIFVGDNGRCHLRGKCWLYDAGLHVPLIVRWPNKTKPGTIVNQLVSMLDVSATILDIGDAQLPKSLDGAPLFGPKSKPRDCIFAARDQVDEVVDHIRCVRTEQFKYIRNYVPEIGYQECKYVQDHRPMLSVIHDLNAQGKLQPAQKLMLAETKPMEELYDLSADPFELNNLAFDPKYAKTLETLRLRLDQWISDTSDTGLARFSIDKAKQ